MLSSLVIIYRSGRRKIPAGANARTVRCSRAYPAPGPSVASDTASSGYRRSAAHRRGLENHLPQPAAVVDSLGNLGRQPAWRQVYNSPATGGNTCLLE